MISISLGELLFAALFVVMLALCLLWKQAIAPWIFVSGTLLFAYLAASVLLGLSFPYRTWNISIYCVFFVACILTACGGAGCLVRVVRFLKSKGKHAI
ncbi:MAG TPA: hypothetical protein VNH11_28510 [Pirellulales bacterium]|nr:hypothetical protein [Pirellulales bacterium]